MVSEYLFAVCANITCTVRYTFLHTPKRYLARLSCAYTCISPNRFRLNCIIYAPSHELFSVSPQAGSAIRRNYSYSTWYVLRGKQKIGKHYRVFRVLQTFLDNRISPCIPRSINENITRNFFVLLGHV